jgi:hypothetical protein
MGFVLWNGRGELRRGLCWLKLDVISFVHCVRFVLFLFYSFA